MVDSWCYASEIDKSQYRPVVNNLQGLAMYGSIMDGLRAVYVENLEIVLFAVESFLDWLEGRSDITLDHGELPDRPSALLPSRRFNQLGGTSHKEPRYVPWLVVDATSRREITEDCPAESIDRERVYKPLESLGYVRWI